MICSQFERIPFQNLAKERLRQIYAVLYFLSNGATRREAIFKASDYFPQIHDRYQTIESKISTQIGVSLDTFFEWYKNGTSLSELIPRLKLNEHDRGLFAELLDASEPEPQPLSEELDDSGKTLVEGTVKLIAINAYERNPKARKICIEHYGTVCSVCEFSFQNKYGSVGRGYIHVHHLRLMSEIKEDYVVDPIRDLRPICPNCHAMIHTRKPPYTVEEMKKIMKNTT
jgi:predicted HNH restriction endonuclease